MREKQVVTTFPRIIKQKMYGKDQDSFLRERKLWGGFQWNSNSFSIEKGYFIFFIKRSQWSQGWSKLQRNIKKVKLGRAEYIRVQAARKLQKRFCVNDLALRTITKLRNRDELKITRKLLVRAVRQTSYLRKRSEYYNCVPFLEMIEPKGQLDVRQPRSIKA